LSSGERFAPAQIPLAERGTSRQPSWPALYDVDAALRSIKVDALRAPFDGSWYHIYCSYCTAVASPKSDPPFASGPKLSSRWCWPLGCLCQHRHYVRRSFCKALWALVVSYILHLPRYKASRISSEPCLAEPRLVLFLASLDTGLVFTDRLPVSSSLFLQRSTLCGVWTFSSAGACRLLSAC
jgi:hypothetical protein